MSAEANLKQAIAQSIQNATPSSAFLLSAAMIGAPRADVSGKAAASAVQMMDIRREDAWFMFQLGLNLAKTTDTNRSFRGDAYEVPNPEWQNVGAILTEKAYKAAPDIIEDEYLQMAAATCATFEALGYLLPRMHFMMQRSERLQAQTVDWLTKKLRAGRQKLDVKASPYRSLTYALAIAENRETNWLDKRLAVDGLFTYSPRGNQQDAPRTWLSIKQDRMTVALFDGKIVDCTDMAAFAAPYMAMGLRNNEKRWGSRQPADKPRLADPDRRNLIAVGHLLMQAAKAKQAQAGEALAVFNDQVIVPELIHDYDYGVHDLRNYMRRRKPVALPVPDRGAPSRPRKLTAPSQA